MNNLSPQSRYPTVKWLGVQPFHLKSGALTMVLLVILCTSNVPGFAGTFTPAQRPGHYRGCSVLRYLRPRNLAASFAAATGTAGVTAALRRSQSANQRLR